MVIQMQYHGKEELVQPFQTFPCRDAALPWGQASLSLSLSLPVSLMCVFVCFICFLSIYEVAFFITWVEYRMDA